MALHAQDAAPVPHFAVATVKPSRLDGWDLRYTDDGLAARGVSLEQMVEEAYAAYLPGGVTGGASWMTKDTFDVVGKLDVEELPEYRELTLHQRQAMLQGLLADRFKLRVHRETKQVPAFALEVGPHGLLATPAKETLASGVKGIQGVVRVMQPGHLEAADFSCGGFATVLQGTGLGRMVVDRTGLAGRYDFALHWTPESAGDGGAWPPLPKALQEQLGLRLVSTTAAMEVVVIDGAEKPTEN